MISKYTTKDVKKSLLNLITIKQNKPDRRRRILSARSCGRRWCSRGTGRSAAPVRTLLCTCTTCELSTCLHSCAWLSTVSIGKFIYFLVNKVN